MPIDEAALKDALGTADPTDAWSDGTMQIADEPALRSYGAAADAATDRGYRRGPSEAGNWARGQDPREQREWSARGDAYRPLILERRDGVRILQWHVSPGQTVAEGQPVVEYTCFGGDATFIADRAFVVAAIHAQPGQNLRPAEPAASLRDIEPDSHPAPVPAAPGATQQFPGLYQPESVDEAAPAPVAVAEPAAAPVAQPTRQQRSAQPAVLAAHDATEAVGGGGVVSSLKALYQRSVSRPSCSLRVTRADGTQWTVSVPLRGRLVIGRHTGCDVVLNAAAASRQHAQAFVDAEGRVVLEDLGSRNKLLVNNQQLERVVLQPGLRVTIADHVLELA